MPGEGEMARPADDYVVVEAPGAQHLEPPLDPETASGTVTNIGYFALPRHYHAPRHSRLHFWAVEVTLPILVCSLGVLFSVATLVLLVRRKGGMWDHGRGGGIGSEGRPGQLEGAMCLWAGEGAERSSWGVAPSFESLDRIPPASLLQHNTIAQGE